MIYTSIDHRDLTNICASIRLCKITWYFRFEKPSKTGTASADPCRQVVSEDVSSGGMTATEAICTKSKILTCKTKTIRLCQGGADEVLVDISITDVNVFLPQEGE